MSQEIGFASKFENAVTLAETVKNLPVTNVAEYSLLGVEVDKIRQMEKELKAEWEAYKQRPEVAEVFKNQEQKIELAKKLEEARKDGKGRLISFEDKQEALRKLEEARLAAEAQARADEEALAAAESNPAEADAILEEAASTKVPTVVLPKETPKVKGHTRRVINTWRFIDPIKKAGVKQDFLSPDEAKISGVVRSMGKAAEGLIGGIIVETKTV